MGLIVLRGYGVNQLVVTDGYGGPASIAIPTAAPVVPWGYGPASKVVTAGYGGLFIGPVVFCRPVFLLDEVCLQNDRTLRVRFNRPPMAGVGSSSAAVVDNYTLQRTDGPVSAPGILAATLASDDTDVVDLHLAFDLVPGSYMLSIATVVASAEGAAITPPTNWVFAVAPQVVSAPSVPGSDEYAFLLRHFHPVYGTRPNWRKLLRALATGDASVNRAAASATRQLSVATAAGRYLTRRAGDMGIERPSGVGMPDDPFRQLARSIANEKLTIPAFYRALESFYGPAGARGFAEAALAEPYVLGDETTLDLVTDERLQVRIVFRREDFRVLRRASAEEVAAVITRQLTEVGDTGYAVPERVGSRIVLRIYSGTRGARSSIRVAGGTAWPSFDFPGVIFPDPTPDPAAIWTVTVPSPGVARWRPDSVAYFDLREVVAGDVLVVTGTQFANQGSFPVVAVRYAFAGGFPDAYVDVLDPGAVPETTVQCLRDECRFFHPVVRTIRDNPERVLATQQDGSALVSLAATARAVGRGVGLAAYTPDATHFNVLALTRDASGVVSVTTDAPHGLSPGSQFDLVGVRPGATPPSVAGTPVGQLGSGSLIPDQQSGVSDAAATMHWSSDQALDVAYHRAVRLPSGDVLVAGGARVGVSVTLRPQVEIFHVDPPVPAMPGQAYAYRWRAGALVSGMPALGHSLAALDGSRSGQVVQVGGYLTSPWADLAVSNYTTHAHVHTPIGTANWVTTTTAGTTDASSTLADATAVLLVDGTVLFVGGSRRPNFPFDGGSIFDPVSGTIFPALGLHFRRIQPNVVRLADDRILMVGGRQPFKLPGDTAVPTDPGLLSYWDFEDQPPTVTTFGGGIPISSASAVPRPVGKGGWAVKCTLPIASTGGANQTTANASMLSGSWAVYGWATSGDTGVIVQNSGAQPALAAADNAMFVLAIDPADRKFVVRWQHDGGVTVEKRTAATVDTLWPGVGDSTYRRWHSFALTRILSGPNQIVTLFLDGVQAGQWTDVAATGGSSGLFAIGKAHIASDKPSLPAYMGCIDELALTTTPMTAQLAEQTHRLGEGVTYDSPTFPTLQPCGTVLNSCEVLDSLAFGTSRTGTMSYSRFAAGMCLLPDGRVLAIGGVGYHASTKPRTGAPQRELELRSVEIFDPTTGGWSPLPDMAEPHSSPTVVLSGGRVYVAGGFTSKLVEVLYLDTMTWGAVASLPTVSAHSAGGLAGDAVMLVSGGSAVVSGGPEVSSPQDYHALLGVPAVSSGGLNGRHGAVAVPAPTALTFTTPDYRIPTSSVTGELIPASVPADPEHRGPYLADPTGPLAVFSAAALTTVRLDAGGEYSEISIDDSSQFPDEPGFLVFALGQARQIGPVRYLGRAGANRLIMGAVGPLPDDVPIGTQVRLAARGGAVPQHPFGWAYVTGTTAGRVAAERVATQISATGIDLEIEIRYPGDRGLGGEGSPTAHASKLSDVVEMYAGDDVDAEMKERRGS